MARYYYFKLLKQAYGFRKHGEMEATEPYYGSTKKIYAKSKHQAAKQIRKKYSHGVFKWVSRLSVWINRRKKAREVKKNGSI